MPGPAELRSRRAHRDLSIMFTCCRPASDADKAAGFVEELPSMRDAANVAADENFPSDGPRRGAAQGARPRGGGALGYPSAPCPALYIVSVSDDPSSIFGACITAAGGQTDLTRMEKRMTAPARGITMQ